MLTPAGLKGADRALYTHLSERWQVEMMHVVQRTHEESMEHEPGESQPPRSVSWS